MNTSIQVVHQTTKRVRCVDRRLKGQYNIRQLEHDVKHALSLEHVRINPKLGSIVFEGASLHVKMLCEHLGALDLQPYQTCDTFLEGCFEANEKAPSMQGIVRAGSALVFQPFFPNDYAQLTLSLGASLPLLSDGAKELFKEGLTSKVLESLAVVVSLARKDYVAANVTNVMIESGEYIEETMVRKSDELIKELAKPNIEEAWIEVDNEGVLTQERIQAALLKIGDIVIAGAGDTICIDGHIIDGIASVNQVSMTGEAAAVKKERGDRVISGTVVESGRIRIWAEQVGADTATERIKHYIKSALDEKS